MHNIHNVFHIRLSLFLKQHDMNEEDILRITDELLLRSFILETVLSFIYLGTILLILFTNCIVLYFVRGKVEQHESRVCFGCINQRRRRPATYPHQILKRVKPFYHHQQSCSEHRQKENLKAN